jgi:replicative DNA helicase
MVNHNTQTQTVRMAPHSVEAEEAVLDSILIDPEAIFRVSPLLHADDFFVVKKGWVWEALFALHERHEPIDFLTVCHELEARDQLDEISGAAYVSRLVDVVPTAIHVEGYARIVERASLRRKLLGAASDIARFAYDEDRAGGDPDDVVAQAAQFVFNTCGAVAGRNVLPLIMCLQK